MAKKKPPAAPAPDGVHLEYRDVDTLAAWPRNPKGHDLGALHASLDRFGFVTPLVLDDATQRLVAGHGRLEALLQRRATGKPAPARIRVDPEGRWFVPVLTGVAFATEQEAEAFLIADNRLTTLGGWQDEALLATMLGELAQANALQGVGYDGEDVDALLKRLAGPGPPADLSITRVYQVILECRDEAHQAELLARFAQEGLPCKALII
jgi:hypothetical protein